MDWQWITLNITSNYNLALFIWVLFNPKIGISYLYETFIKQIDRFKLNYLQIVVFKRLQTDNSNIINYFTLFYYYFMVSLYYIFNLLSLNNTKYFKYIQSYDKPNDYYLECCNDFGRTKLLLYNTNIHNIYVNKYYLTIGKNRKNGLFDTKVVMELLVKCNSGQICDIYTDFNNFDYIEDNHVMTLKSFLEHHKINHDNKYIYIKYRESFTLDETIVYDPIDSYLDKPIDKLL